MDGIVWNQESIKARGNLLGAFSSIIPCVDSIVEWHINKPTVLYEIIEMGTFSV